MLLLKFLEGHYMQANKFTATWINLRESYDMLSRSDLLQNLYKNNKMNLKKVIDLGVVMVLFLDGVTTKILYMMIS